tara:strand:+ start:576 stop:1103 length:528 start_codon:yes stop_codon:yes gene_type:complete
MYRDNLIKLILKEILKDIYLVNHVYKILVEDEMYLMSILHKEKTNYLREDIKILYPGLIKTALFSNIRFDNQGDLDPGYSFYTVKPLTSCGYIVDYDMVPPIKTLISEYNKYNKNYNSVNLINRLRKKKSKKKRYQLNIITKKSDELHRLENSGEKGLSLWYDFENKEFNEQINY